MSFFKTLWTVTKKELVDMFRDRKAVMLGLVLGPLLGPVLILGVGMLAEKKIRTQLESTLDLPVVGAEHAPNLVRFLESRNIKVIEGPPNPDDAVREQVFDVILHIGPEFAQKWRDGRMAPVELAYDSSRQDSSIPVSRVARVLQEYGQTVAMVRGLDRGISPEAGVPVQVRQRDLSTPEARRGMLLMFLPYMLIMFSFVGGAALVIDVTAGERERQSLEPLLATPVARSAIMSGKILAACLFGMLSILLIVSSFKLAFQFAPGALGMVNVSMLIVVQLLLVLMPLVLVGTTLLTLISASVKSVKEAQSYMSILMFLPIIPTIVLMINPVKTQLWQFMVPFLAQNQMILRLVRGEAISGVEWGTYMAAGLGLAAALWVVAARLYHKEKLAISA